MEERLKQIENKFSIINLYVLDLEKRIEELEKSESVSGVYLEGCPDYAADYITKMKEGE